MLSELVLTTNKDIKSDSSLVLVYDNNDIIKDVVRYLVENNINVTTYKYKHHYLLPATMDLVYVILSSSYIHLLFDSDEHFIENFKNKFKRFLK